MSIKYVAIIQCDKAHTRCSGFHCTDAFHTKTGYFTEYGEDVKYTSFTCGGCAGKLVNVKMTQLAKAAMKKASLKKDEIAVHFASCVTNDNKHSDRCIFLEQMKTQVLKAGFTNIKYGSYISKTAQKKREDGLYKTY